ncbi:MAG: glucosamine-6-phosphate isomerase, partial [Oscillospiraceae bacterium]|nr:glucosamine-6-phosphate isomerase [Oscillospiraceae bacterium]
METKHYNLIDPKDLGKNTTIDLQVCENEVDMYWRGAIDVLEVISANNAKGEPTVMVVPYGPLGPYARLVHLVNKYRISLKNCVFINMDEYMENETQYISQDHPLSFRG